MSRLRRAYEAARRVLVVRVLVGTLIGLAIGVGVAIVFGQRGSFTPRQLLWSVVIGMGVGLFLSTVPLPDRAVRAVTWGSRVLAVLSLVVLPAVTAVAFSCYVIVDADGPGGGPAVDAFTSTFEEPLVVHLEDGNVVDVLASADVPAGSMLEVAAVAIDPPFVRFDGPVPLVYQPIADGTRSTRVEIRRVGPPDFYVSQSELGPQRPLPPLGIVTLRATVLSVEGDVEVCDGGDVYVRFVATPRSTLIGWLAIFMVSVGFLALPSVTPPRRPPGPPSPEDDLDDLLEDDLEDLPEDDLDEDGTRVLGVVVSRGDQDWEADQRAPIPPAGWHVPGLEMRLALADGQPVPPDQPLTTGASYVLSVTVGEGVQDPPTPAQLEDVVVHGAHDGTPFEPARVDPSTATASIPIEPESAGLFGSVLDVLHRGNHLQTERLTLPVVEPGAGADALQTTQTTQTTLSTNEISATALARQKPRDVVVIVEVLEGRVLSRVHAHDKTVSPPVQPEHGALVEATAALAGSVRDALTDRLAEGGGTRLRLPPFRHDEDLVVLAMVGRELRHALMGSDPRPTASLRRFVTDSALVQVVQDTLRLGSATLPYQLLYDHPLSGGVADPTICRGDHEVDACPSLEDLEVVCPTGLWGNRAIVEEILPRTEDEPDPLPPPVPVMTGPGAAFVDPDDALHRDPARPDAPRVDVVAELGLEPLTDLPAVIDALGRDVGVLYLYGHSASRPYASEKGLQVGRGLLLGSDLRERAIERPNGGIVLLNACGSGDGRVTDVMTLLRAMLEIGSTAVIATETTMWAPFANQLARDVLLRVAEGEQLGRALLDLRRSWWRDSGNHVGLTFRLHGYADAVWQPVVPESAEASDEPAPVGGETAPRPAEGGGAA